MITFKTVLKKFSEKGEKTGWTYIEITEERAAQLLPENKKSFRTKGTLDAFAFKQVALLPMGGGSFIMPINAAMRKSIGKRIGNEITVSIEVDNSTIQLSEDLMSCLADTPEALAFFNTLAKSHQNYFSKWIESAKTIDTKSKRILMTVNAMSNKISYSEMIRASQKPK